MSLTVRVIASDLEHEATGKQLELLRRGLEDARKVSEPDVFVKAHILSLETDIQMLEDAIREFEKK